jgi:hypothetical protein
VDEERLEMLNECANHHTKKIKAVTSEDISRVENFAHKSLNPKIGFPLFLFSYKPSWIPWTKGCWTSTQLGPPCDRYSCKQILEWLNENYHTKKHFKFMYYAQEPYLEARCQEANTNKEFEEVIKNCPLLITCTHPSLSWTFEGILIPDPYLMAKHAELASVLDSKKLLPFNKRKSRFFFSGTITGPSVPFSHENIKYNPRHGLFEKTKQWPFLDYNVTNFMLLDHLASPSYKDHILKHYSHLKGESVDFFYHANYKYLLSFDGFGSAWSRVPLILATGSVLILNAACSQYFYCLMVENETHVTIKSDLSNGEQLYKNLEKDQKKAERIGLQGRNFAKLFLTKDAIDTYLWLVLKKIENAYQ